MKKILLFGFLFVVAAACGSCTKQETASNTNANAPTAAKSAIGISDADLIAKETSGWESLKKKDYEAFGNLLASDYTEVEDTGVYDKAGIMTYVKDINFIDVTFSDWKVMPIDKDAAVLTYSVTVKETFKGEAVPPGPYRATAAYVNRDGKWQAIYYQQTLPSTAPPPPTPSNSPPPKAASPATEPAEAGPDPIANEKIVWETFKSKNYDAFAALLAPEFVEVEATGVYDKAGSVKGVKAFDASQFELSEWKAVKFDNDASLVTYLLKGTGPNPEQERHTSIWINRGGKWMALLHQGTPVAKAEPKK